MQPLQRNCKLQLLLVYVHVCECVSVCTLHGVFWQLEIVAVLWNDLMLTWSRCFRQILVETANFSLWRHAVAWVRLFGDLATAERRRKAVAIGRRVRVNLSAPTRQCWCFSMV